MVSSLLPACQRLQALALQRRCHQFRAGTPQRVARHCSAADSQQAREVSARSSSSAASVPGPAGDASKSEGKPLTGMMYTAFLGSLFAAWYAFNIIFNIYNKQTLTVFHFPITITAFQFLIGSIIGLLWFVATGTKIDLSKPTVKAVLPLAGVHTLGNLLTNVSLGMVAVSFTHTIKALEPMFSVILSSMFLGAPVDPWVVASLVPIIGGVAGASMSEVSFNWPGFISALGSNITFQSRNVFSKKFMTPDIKDRVGGSIGLFSLITMMSFLILAPIALIVEGVKFTPGALQALGIVDCKLIYMRALGAALTFHLYQQVSYMILSRVTPVTHAIGNCTKRVIVILASIIVFKNPMPLQTKVCTAIALSGVFAYSQVKRIRGDGKTKSKSS